MTHSCHPYTVPSQLYQTADGWIFIMCESQHFWGIFCDLAEHPYHKQDVRFDGPQDRYENRDSLTPVLDERLGRCSTADWVALLSEQVPYAPVNNIAQSLYNPFFQERVDVQEVPSRTARL